MNSHSAITIRAATTGDAETIADFNILMARETESLELNLAIVRAGVRAALADPNKAIYFLAEIEGHVAAQLMITHEWSDWRNGDIWWIQSVYVQRAFRRRGAFKALFADVERRAREASVVGIRLYVDRSNAGARQTYESLGLSVSHYDLMEKMWG